MKVARLVCTALAVSAIVGWATSSSACDNQKGAKASAAAVTASKAAACSAEMAAHCTPEMMAACKASIAAGGPDLCPGMKASAASGTCPARGTRVSAAFVSANGADHCAMAKASAVTAAAHGTCGAKGASVSAVTAATTPSTPATIVLAGANGSCAAKGARTAAGQCTGHGMATMAAASSHADCEACVDMADCSGQLDAAGAHRQVVRLKNGIMYVYTADSPRMVSAVQAAVAHRVERMMRFASAGEKAHLCTECKAMRGAMASGKLTREVVNIEGGSLTLITSNDPTVVAKIHAMADDKVAARVKS
jgi:hypothetical protein